MELNYLWDTNSVIYYLQEQFNPSAADFIDNLLIEEKPTISVITEMEALSWRSASEADILLINNFIADCVTYQLDESVKLATIAIRKAYRIKLPDAIIAATALVYDKILITRNVADFGKLPQIKLLNPFAV
jgi:predicted nucleic acid-binding protein